MRIPASIESQARMTPSRVHARRPHREKIDCPCCNGRNRDAGDLVHPVLGLVCMWCERAFDMTRDRDGLKLRPSQSCPLCAEGVCTVHE